MTAGAAGKRDDGTAKQALAYVYFENPADAQARSCARATEGQADKAAGKVQNEVGGLKDALRGK